MQDQTIIRNTIENYGRMGIYSAQYGGVCERCWATQVPVTHTYKWQDGKCQRRHQCKCGKIFKTTQYDHQPEDCYR